MPASEPQKTYEDVFREFVQRSLEEEKRACSESPSEQPAAALFSDGDGAGDGPVAAAAASRGRGRGRGKGRGSSQSGNLSSGSEPERDSDRPPPAKRPRGRGRGRGGRPRSRGRAMTARVIAASGGSSNSGSGAETGPSQDSHGRESESEQQQHDEEEGSGVGRRRSSRRSRGRAVDYKHLLQDDEDEDDPAAGESDGAGAQPSTAEDDESGDDWMPPSDRVRSSGDEAPEEPVASAAAAPARRRRGRPAGCRGRGRGATSASSGGVTRYKLPEQVAMKVNTPPPPSNVTTAPAGPHPTLKTGDFLISVEDVNLDRPPIWRIDGKYLIQKYEPIKGKGQRLYKNMATYMSWSPNSDKFRPVSVRYHQMGRTEIIVELMDNPHSSTFNLSKMLSIEETAKYLENFEIYMQTLISQSLDANFLLEITQEGDEYFMKNVTIVQETNQKRKNKILELKSWDNKTQAELDSLPVLELVLLRNVPPSECAVCHQTANARLVQLYGRPYDRTTLLTKETDRPAGKQQLNMCSFCAGLADLYNKVEHLTYHLYLRCCEKVTLRKKEAPDDDSTRILNDILADEAWLSKAFSDVQQIWGDVDQIYTAAKEEEEQEQHDETSDGQKEKTTTAAAGKDSK